MIAAIKRLIVLVCLLIILAFIFSDSLLFYISRWHEKSGDVKKAMSGYTELLKKRPEGRWAEKAKEAIERIKK